MKECETIITETTQLLKKHSLDPETIQAMRKEANQLQEYEEYSKRVKEMEVELVCEKCSSDK